MRLPEKDHPDHTIYLINELGQKSRPLGLDMAEEIKEVPTELDVIVQEINHLHQQGISAVAQPWLPPLKERITLDELDKVVPRLFQLKRLIGDEQEAVAIDLSKDGNILLKLQVQERPLSYRRNNGSGSKQSPEN